jgi:DNA-directed RNA polymerase subunit RPC12/RpoP
MNVSARCGFCGETFRLVELISAGAQPGRCPRCGASFAPSYVPVLDTAVRELLAAADALEGALWQVREVAPQLDVDARRLGLALESGRP